MTRVFVFTNHKGCVGKSTSATNTAFGIAAMLRRASAPNARVLLIDPDSQAHATLITTGRKDYGTDDSLYSVLVANRQNTAQTLLNCIVQSTWDADLHVLPASPMKRRKSLTAIISRKGNCDMWWRSHPSIMPQLRARSSISISVVSKLKNGVRRLGPTINKIMTSKRFLRQMRFFYPTRAVASHFFTDSNSFFFCFEFMCFS